MQDYKPGGREPTPVALLKDRACIEEPHPTDAINIMNIEELSKSLHETGTHIDSDRFNSLSEIYIALVMGLHNRDHLERLALLTLSLMEITL